MAKDVLINTGQLDNLTKMAQRFTNFQELLVEKILPALIAKDGTTAKNDIQSLTDLLPKVLDHKDLGLLKSLEFEAILWEEYKTVQQHLYTNPKLAFIALDKAATNRNAITHWPSEYEPTLADLERLGTVIETNRHANILSGDGNGPFRAGEAFDARPTAKPRTVSEAKDFWLDLSEDLIKSRWAEGLAELLAKLELEPEHEGLKLAVEQLRQHLLQRHKILATQRACPGQLAERANVIEGLLSLPPASDQPPRIVQELRQELAEIQNLEDHIARDQQDLFQNPELVFARALAGNYELFDDVGLSMATLKTVHQTGRWATNEYNQEIARLDDQIERYLNITNLFHERKSLIETMLEANIRWADAVTGVVETFASNTLRFYLTTAQGQLQTGEDPTNTLTRAKALLESEADLLSKETLDTYKNLYDHLLQVHQSSPELKDNLRSLTNIESETQLEIWFKSYRFEECYANLGNLPSPTAQQKWEMRLNDAGQIKEILDRGEPQQGNNHFRKKQNTQIYTEILDALSHQVLQAEPMALALYKTQIDALYKRIWHQLERLDKKSAQRFEPTIQSIS